MKMSELRSRQPLSEDDFAAIRRNVMTAIAARNQRRFFPIAMRFAIAAAVVIAIGLVFVARRPVAHTVVTVKKTTPVLEKVPIAIATIATPPVKHPVAHRPRRRQVTHPRAEYAAATQPNIRLEFRTSDPDVRIIWIASQTPSTTTGGKS